MQDLIDDLSERDQLIWHAFVQTRSTLPIHLRLGDARMCLEGIVKSLCEDEDIYTEIQQENDKLTVLGKTDKLWNKWQLDSLLNFIFEFKNDLINETYKPVTYLVKNTGNKGTHLNEIPKYYAEAALIALEDFVQFHFERKEMDWDQLKQAAIIEGQKFDRIVEKEREKKKKKRLYLWIIGLILFGSVGWFVMHIISIMDRYQFDPSPSGGIGFTSIYVGYAKKSGGIYDSQALPVLAPGESDTVNIFTDYKALTGSRPLKNARVIYTTRSIEGSSFSYSFETILKASNASAISDVATVTNLPNRWRIEAIYGHIQNTHGDTDPIDCTGYSYSKQITENLFTNKGMEIGNLDTLKGGWCAQGTAVVAYVITNIE